jgi:CheY-like chemotaxis protein
MRSFPTVAVVNSAPDAVEMLRESLEDAGFLVVTCFTHEIRDGRIDFEAFVRTHKPSVISYDIAPPYAKNVRLFQHVRSLDFVRDIQFVLTAMNPANVHKLVGHDEKIYEVVDRDEDLHRWIDAVKQASRARPTR